MVSSKLEGTYNHLTIEMETGVGKTYTYIKTISYNGAEPKHDIRDWAQEREKMGKGVTLNEEEARELYNKLKDIFG